MYMAFLTSDLSALHASYDSAETTIFTFKAFGGCILPGMLNQWNWLFRMFEARRPAAFGFMSHLHLR